MKRGGDLLGRWSFLLIPHFDKRRYWCGCPGRALPFKRRHIGAFRNSNSYGIERSIAFIVLAQSSSQPGCFDADDRVFFGIVGTRPPVDIQADNGLSQGFLVSTKGLFDDVT